MREYIVDKLGKEYVESLLLGKVVVEKIPPMKITAFIIFAGECANHSLAAAIYEKIAREVYL